MKKSWRIWGFRSITVKLVMIFILIVIAPMAITTYINMYLFYGDVEAELRQNSLMALEHAQKFLFQYSQKAEKIASLLTHADEVVRHSTLQEIENFLYANEAFWSPAIVEVFSGKHQSFVRNYVRRRNIERYFSHSGDPRLKKAMGLEIQTDYVASRFGLSIKSTAPIIDPSTFRVVGAVIVSYPLDAIFLQEIQDHIKADVTVQWNENGDIHSTLIDPLGNQRMHLREEGISTFQMMGTKTINRKEVINDIPYSVSYGLLKNNEADPVAVLSTAINCEGAEKYRQETSRLILISSIIAFALAAGIGVWTAKTFTRPIHKLLDATNRLASGRMDERVDLEQADEIGKLASAFNEMAVRLEQQNHQLIDALRVTEAYGRKIAETNSDLENLNADLESRVALRTAELMKSNHDLEQTILALKEAKDSAEKANSAKSEFLSNMSHELRTPLNHIIGFTELVVGEDFGELNEIQREYLKDVLSSGNHLLALINDILDIAKIESGKMELDLSEVVIRELLEGSLTMVKEKAMKKGCSLIYTENSLPETIHVDERKLKQVLYNLLSNAVKFTPPGGKIELQAETVDHSWLSANLPIAFREDVLSLVDGCPRSFLHVALMDTGIGIRPHSLKSIFDVFQQEDKTISGRFGGTGLGLSLCKQLVELHKGGIWVDSIPGEGSTFHFLLPVDTAPEEAALSDSVGETKRCTFPLVVLASHDEEMRKDLRNVLETDAYGIR